MKHITPYIPKDIYESNIMIDNIEKYIPQHLREKVELELIISRGARSIHRCYEHIANGTLDIPLMSEEDVNSLKEACNDFLKDITHSLLNEQSATVSAPTQISGDNVENVSDKMSAAATKAAEEIEKKGGNSAGVFEMFDKLINAITEDKSPIGIIHLILDIIGVVGDFIPLAGNTIAAAADVLNAVIYIFRGSVTNKEENGYMFLMAGISLLSAVPYAGIGITTLKATLKATKTGKALGKIFGSLYSPAVAGATKYSDDAIKLMADAGPAAINTLKRYATPISKAANGAAVILEKFFTGFIGKIVSFIPAIGKPLQKFFSKIGSFFGAFKSRAAKISKEMPTMIKKAEQEQLHMFFELSSKKRAKITAKGNDLIVSHPKHDPIIISGGLLKASDMLISKFGPGLSKSLEKKFGKTQAAAAKFYADAYATLAKAAAKEGTSLSFGKAAAIGAKVYTFKSSILMLLGREALKAIHHHGQVPKAEAVNDEEVALIGMARMKQHFKQQRARLLKANPNAHYAIPMADVLNNSDAIDILNNGSCEQLQLIGEDCQDRVFNGRLIKRAQTDREIREYLRFVGFADDVFKSKKSNTSEQVKLKHIKRPD